jgi:hypothetical protein
MGINTIDIVNPGFGGNATPDQLVMDIFENFRGGKIQMGGIKKCSSQRPWINAVNSPGDRKLPRASVTPAGDGEKGCSETLLQTERVIAALAGEVIGRNVILHSLLGSTDFVALYSGKGSSQSLPKHLELGGAPFQVSFLSHKLHYECQYLTIVSKGYLRLTDGRETDVWMELSLERIGVSPAGAAIKWVKGESPLVLNFGSSPESLTEAAFSFDIDRDRDRYGWSSGCGFLTMISRNDKPGHDQAPRLQPAGNVSLNRCL